MSSAVNFRKRIAAGRLFMLRSRAVPAPRDLHPLLIALLEAWARRWGWDPEDVWRWLEKEAAPPAGFVAGCVDAFFPLVRPADFLAADLTSRHNLATVDQDMQEATRGQRVSKARLREANRRHPFVRALVAKGLTITEFARTIGYPRTVVQSWYDSRPDNARPIPRKAAERIRDLLEVPLDAWRKMTPDGS